MRKTYEVHWQTSGNEWTSREGSSSWEIHFDGPSSKAKAEGAVAALTLCGFDARILLEIDPPQEKGGES